MADLSPTDRIEVLNLFKSMRATHGFLRDIREPVDPGLERLVRCPTLIIASRDDGQVPTRHAEHLHRRIYDSALVWSPRPQPHHLVRLSSQRTHTTGHPIPRSGVSKKLLPMTGRVIPLADPQRPDRVLGQPRVVHETLDA